MNDIEDKIEVVTYLLFLHGKLISLSIKLKNSQEATREDTDRATLLNKELGDFITDIREQLMTQWQQNTNETITQLRDLNGTIQNKIRDLNRDANQIRRVSVILEKFDKVITIASKLLPI